MKGFSTLHVLNLSLLMPDYPHALPSKLPRTSVTIFSVMSALAKEKGAINLSQGFPGFDAPNPLKERVSKAIADGFNQYAPMQGLPQLREAVAELRLEISGTRYRADDEVVITAGATQALFTAITALIREDDEVILFTPAYDCYAPAVELAGGKPIYVKLKAPNYQVDWDEARKVINRKTRMMIINTPHNPTGAVLHEDDLTELKHIAAGSDMIILSDEVYEHMVFDGQKHVSPAADEELASRTIVVGSFGKTFHATGWKIGYVAGPSQLMAEFRKVHQYNVFAVNTPMQKGLADYLLDDGGHIRALSAFYQQKRDRFLSALEGSRFTWKKTPGTYFQLLNYKAISNEEDVQVAQQWTASPGVASIPISVFYHQPQQNHVLRFCFAKNDDELIAAAERLKSL